MSLTLVIHISTMLTNCYEKSEITENKQATDILSAAFTGCHHTFKLIFSLGYLPFLTICGGKILTLLN